MLLPGVEDRSEFTSAVVIHVPLGKHVPCPLIEQLTPVTPLTCRVQMSGALNKVVYCVRLQSTSFLGPTFPGSHCQLER